MHLPTTSGTHFGRSPEVDWLHCEVVQTILDIQILAREWEVLHGCIPNASMCAHPEWTIAWWNNFGHRGRGTGRETQPYVLTFRDADRKLVAVIPLYEDQPKSLLKLRRLRSMGYLGRERAYDMTEEPTVLVEPGYEQAVFKCLAGHLRLRLEQGRWDFVAMIGPGSLALDAGGSLESLALVRSNQRSGSDDVKLPESWEAYRRSLSKSMRENIPYYPRLLTRDGHRWEVRKLDKAQDIPAAVARLAELHKSRAESVRGRQHSNHLHTATQVGFLRDFLVTMAKEESAFIAELLVDGQVVASQAFYGQGETLTLSYSGYDERFYRYSPIFVIHSVVFREALEGGIRRINFLRNIGPWKTRWLAQTGEPMTRMYLVRRGLFSFARYFGHTAWIGFERDVIRRIPVLWGRAQRRLRQILRESMVREKGPDPVTGTEPAVN
ncbi:MAG: GNAT family N-acetyltransferase [Armatimonadetes bacterium]|nr:GNAT family N-acetyltransferase [Armatimonadota bacterium]